ncbi:hypothetical protein GHV40_04805 [Devosia sp. D6-9]|nr:hypothetical protein GHV40_04805 [Devosia sp. D6-9]
MAYDRSEIGRKIAQLEQQLIVDGKEPPVGAVLDAVVQANICGRGVAQQVLSEMRKDRNAATENTAPVLLGEEMPDGLDHLTRYFEDIHRAVDAAKAGAMQAAATSLQQVKSSFSTVIAEQGMAGKRKEDAGQAEIERLETSLIDTRNDLAEATAKLDEADGQRAELNARLIEAEEVLEVQRGRIKVLEQERGEYKDQAEKVRGELEAYRQDLVAVRQAETSLRDELRRVAGDHVARSEHEALKSQHDVLAGVLADERARNAALHEQVLRLVGTMAQPSERVAAPVA